MENTIAKVYIKNVMKKIISKIFFSLLLFMFLGAYIWNASSSVLAVDSASEWDDNQQTIQLNMPFDDVQKTIELGENPNSFDIISKYVSIVYKWWATVTGLLAVLMLVVWGVQYILSGADPGQKDDAKSRIQQALIALTLLLLSGLILHTINPNFFA